MIIAPSSSMFQSMLIAWVLTCLTVSAFGEATLKYGTDESYNENWLKQYVNKVANEDDAYGESSRQTHFLQPFNDFHRRKERQTLLREFVLDDFGLSAQNTPNARNNSYSIENDGTRIKNDKNINSGFQFQNKNKINKQTTTRKILKLAKRKRTRAVNNVVKRKEINKVKVKVKVNEKSVYKDNQRPKMTKNLDRDYHYPSKVDSLDNTGESNMDISYGDANDHYPSKVDSLENTDESYMDFSYGDDNEINENKESAAFRNKPPRTVDKFYEHLFNYFSPDENNYNTKYEIFSKIQPEEANERESSLPIPYPSSNLNYNLYGRPEMNEYHGIKKYGESFLIDKNDRKNEIDQEYKNIKPKNSHSKVKNYETTNYSDLKNVFGRKKKESFYENNFEKVGGKNSNELMNEIYDQDKDSINKQKGMVSKQHKQKRPRAISPCRIKIDGSEVIRKTSCKYGDVGTIDDIGGSEIDIGTRRKQQQRKSYELKKIGTGDVELTKFKILAINVARKGDLGKYNATTHFQKSKEHVRKKPVKMLTGGAQRERRKKQNKGKKERSSTIVQSARSPKKSKVYDTEDNMDNMFQTSNTLSNGKLQLKSDNKNEKNSQIHQDRTTNIKNKKHFQKDTLNWIVPGKLITSVKYLNFTSKQKPNFHNLTKVSEKSRDSKMNLELPVPKSELEFFLLRVSPRNRSTKRANSSIKIRPIGPKTNKKSLYSLEDVTKAIQKESKEQTTLLNRLFNTPVKSIVTFVKKYILGDTDPGDLRVKDIWPQTTSRNKFKKTKPMKQDGSKSQIQFIKKSSLLGKFSHVRNSKTIKQMSLSHDRSLRKHKDGEKIGQMPSYPRLTLKPSKSEQRNKFRELVRERIFEKKHKSERKLKPTASNETNGVKRSFLSRSDRNVVSRKRNWFIELINVLLNNKMLENSKYSSGHLKKSFLPHAENPVHSSKYNPDYGLKNGKSRVKITSRPYFIPFKRHIASHPDWKTKYNHSVKKTPVNVKRSKSYYSKVRMRTSRNNFADTNYPKLLGIQNTVLPTIPSSNDNFNRQNEFDRTYMTSYTMKSFSSFEYPDAVGNGYDFLKNSKPTLDANYRYSYERMMTERENYNQYFTWEENANSPPPFTFHIYQREPASEEIEWDKLKTNEAENNRFDEYRGIFGNADKDLQQSCINFGKQDFVDFCPMGWVRYKQFCFSINEETHRWSEVSAICSRENGKMAMPKSHEVLAFLVDKLGSKKEYTKPYFVGLRKRDEKWEWIDDTPLSQALSGQVDNEFHSCAVIQEGSLRKMPCDFEAGYICELKRGIEAYRVLTIGDSLTNGYYNGGQGFHPYGQKLERLLNKDDHRCFVLEISGRDGEKSDHMLKRLTSYLNTKKERFNWVIILAGTNDLLMSDSPSDAVADQIIIMHEVVHARGAKSLVITIPEIFCERKDCPGVSRRRKMINKRLREYAAAAGSKAYLSDLALQLSLHRLSLEDRKAFWEPSGVHLKPKGYDRMADLIFEDLMEFIESSSV